MRLLLLFVLGCATSLRGQEAPQAWADSLQSYWDGINSMYKDPAHSPLLPADREHFVALERFAPDPRFCVTAKFKEKLGETFGMTTTTDRRPQYQAVGKLRFKLMGKRQVLTVYRNIDLTKKAGHTDDLFIPFTDLTSGEASYGGGRYLDVKGPLGPSVRIDFNRAYNPYCAYGGRYSCPIPPAENHLEVPVEAGVKAFDH